MTTPRPTDPTTPDVLALREALHDALCSMPKPHGCHAYNAVDLYAAAVRAETLAGSGVVEALLQQTDPLPEDAPIEDTRQRLYSSGWVERGQAIRALAATPPTPALTAARLAEAMRESRWTFLPNDPDSFASAILAALATSPAPEVER